MMISPFTLSIAVRTFPMKINDLTRTATMITMMWVMMEVKGEKAINILGEQSLIQLTIWET